MKIIYVSTLIRYENYGWIYKINLDKKRVIKKIKVSSDTSKAKHGGPHGLVWHEGRLISGTYSDIRVFDGELNECYRFNNECLAGVHGITVNDNKIWVSSCNNEGVFSFDFDGKLIESHWLRENKKLLEYFNIGVAGAKCAKGTDLPYHEQFFHVNYVQDIDDKLIICLHKQGCVWDLCKNDIVLSNIGGYIHDAQVVGSNFYINDTMNKKMKIYGADSLIKREIKTDIYKAREYLSNIKIYFSSDRNNICKVNWLRGLSVMNDDWTLVGGSPATVLLINTKHGKVVNTIKLSNNTCEAVFGIAIKSG